MLFCRDESPAAARSLEQRGQESSQRGLGTVSLVTRPLVFSHSSERPDPCRLGHCLSVLSTQNQFLAPRLPRPRGDPVPDLKERFTLLWNNLLNLRPRRSSPRTQVSGVGPKSTDVWGGRVCGLHSPAVSSGMGRAR